METEHGGVLTRGSFAVEYFMSSTLGSTHAQHMKTSVRFQAVGVAMVLSNVHEHSEKDFVFFSLLRKRIKSQMITNEGGRAVSRNMFITMRSRHVPIPIQFVLLRFLALPLE